MNNDTQTQDFGFVKKHQTLAIFQDNGEGQVVHAPNPDPQILLEYERAYPQQMPFKEVSSEAFTQLVTEHFEQSMAATTKIAKEIEGNLDFNDIVDDLSTTEDLLESQDDAPIIKLLFFPKLKLKLQQLIKTSIKSSKRSKNLPIQEKWGTAKFLSPPLNEPSVFVQAKKTTRQFSSFSE